MTLADKINVFLDLRPDDSFSSFTVAAHIGAAQKSVGAVMARMANERKLRKRERGFYSSAKSPDRNPGFSMAGELIPNGVGHEIAPREQSVRV